MNTLLLTGAALLPAIILCVYIFKKDRVEKEPLGLLLGLFFLGAFSCFPAAIFEEIIIGGIKSVFSMFTTNGELEKLPFLLYRIAYYFIGVALVEEGLKFLILKTVTSKNKEFNCLFDGLIYAIFVSLGFAALENVLYVLENGWMNALLRAVLSVPGHMFFAVMMGYNYSMWNITKRAADIEKQLAQAGVIQSVIAFKPKYLASSIIVPVLAHGFYNFSCTMGNNVAMIVLTLFVLFMYITCFGRIKKMSASDAPNHNYAVALVTKKYPEFAEYLKNQEKNTQAEAE